MKNRPSASGGLLRAPPRGGRWALTLILGVSLAAAGFAGQLGAADPPHVPIPGGLRGKSCFECHIRGGGVVLPSQEKPRIYSKSAAFKSYLESPHGRLRRLGDLRAPMCEDCHLTREWRDILPQEHPDSPIHPRNLPFICAKCHGESMLTTNVSEGSMHLELSHRSLLPGDPAGVRYGFLPGLTKREHSYYIGPFDVTAYVNWFFILITVGTLLVFSLFLSADLIRKLVERRRESAGEDGHEEE